MPKKLTIDKVDRLLSVRSIKRVSDYINSYILMHFQCLICNHIWKSTYNNISSGNRCPKCFNTKLDNKYIDLKLVNRNILKTRLLYYYREIHYLRNI